MSEEKKSNIFTCIEGILGNGKTPKYAREKLGVNWKKNKNLLREDDNAKKSFEPYQINRYISFYDPSLAVIINETTNKMFHLFENKEDIFRYMHHLYGEHPYLFYTELKYIKDPTYKHSKTEEDKEIDKKLKIWANNLEISVRELKNMLEFLGVDIKSLNEQTTTS